MNANTNTPENIIDQLDVQYRLSPMLKLRGTLAYRASKLAGMLLAKEGKRMREENTDLTFTEAVALAGRNVYQWSEDTLMDRGEGHEAQGLEDMGLERSDMAAQLKAMVMYCNKLNFDMLELVDPTGNRRMEDGAKFIGVYHTDHTQRESWKSSVLMHGKDKDDLDTETYAEYVEKIGDPRFTISEAQWTALNTADISMYEAHTDVIVDLILEVGDDECEFDEIPARSQIGLIESLRGKLDSIKDACLKSVKYMRATKAEKMAEASKLVGIIGGMDRQFCDMLDAPRYANYAEYMFNYVPNAGTLREGQVKMRRAIVKEQPVGRVSNVQAQHINNAVDGSEADEVEIDPIVAKPLAAFPTNPSRPSDVRINGVVV